MRYLKLLGQIITFIICFSCKKESPIKNTVEDVEEAILVLNEGNFMSGNSSLSVINSRDQVIEDIFREKNGYGLGDVGQSLFEYQNHIYLVVNNSNKVYELNKDFKVEKIISGLNSPRYFLPINDSVAFITDLYANGVSVVNFKNGNIIKSIYIPGWTEEMVFYQNKVWVTNPYSRSLYIIDPLNQTIEDSVFLPNSFVSTDLEVDANGKLWVLCWGNSQLTITPSLLKLSGKTIEQVFKFSASSNPSRLCISNDKQNLYWIDGGIFKMPVNKNELSVTPIIQKENRNFYNMYIHPMNHEIWVTDAKDYVQKGDVLRYSASGELQKTYKVGIIPSFTTYFRK